MRLYPLALTVRYLTVSRRMHSTVPYQVRCDLRHGVDQRSVRTVVAGTMLLTFLARVLQLLRVFEYPGPGGSQRGRVQLALFTEHQQTAAKE